ncbi:fructosamine kinase family protein [Rodentibacter heidelbergensis]|uniref:Fructosamine kinase family protein n=1 Tax=Rodentibacter heidelbergensis TaxID=1908258 RepID=A0A1V3I7V2_9PAST|nr:fructosamine kinase family protein [Rodentibacter heidelbergensis]OOF35628.1 hypothetical protein BKK48_09215 [Rodentibacter heidelbergensis]
MWKSVSQVLADQFGAYYSIKHKECIHRGEIHEAWIIDDGVAPVFVKANEKSYRSMFRAEADQLEMLRKTTALHLPMVYGVGCSQNHSFLLLEALNIKQQSSLTEDFGHQLAQLHQIAGNQYYGLDFDTWLGPVHQPNKWHGNWATFFSEQRIGWQLQLCKDKGLDFGNIDQIVRLVAQKLAKHHPKPSLLHGNLWIENVCVVNDQTFSYDPACYWGDRECDLAFTELFEPFPEKFYINYDRTFALDWAGYEKRKPIYQLYYLLNFSHRFLGNYIHLTQKTLSDIIES